MRKRTPVERVLWYQAMSAAFYVDRQSFIAKGDVKGAELAQYLHQDFAKTARECLLTLVHSSDGSSAKAL